MEKSEESLPRCQDNLDDQLLLSVVVVGAWVEHFDSETSRLSSFCQFQCAFSAQNTNMTFHICKNVNAKSITVKIYLVLPPVAFYSCTPEICIRLQRAQN